MYERLKVSASPAPNFMHFLKGWRREMIAKGLPFLNEEEIASIRDAGAGRDFSFDK